jgi:hypothetical protein
MAMAKRVAGKEEGKVGKGDGNGNKQMTTRQQQYDDRRRRDDDETTTRRRRDYDKMTTRRDDDETTMRQRDDDKTTTRRCRRTEEATGGTWMDSIKDTGELRTDNTAGGAETTRFWCEYEISDNVTHLACVYYTIFLNPDM